MIKNFSVGNFLSFEEKTTLSLEAKKADIEHLDFTFMSQNESLLKTAVIYGPNASGKSNLIKAFTFFRSFILTPPEKSLEGRKIGIEPFLLRIENEKKPSFFEIEFLDEKKRYVYGFEVSSERIESEWLVRYPNKTTLFKRTRQNFEISKSLKGVGIKEKESTRKNVLFLSMLAIFNNKLAEKILQKIRKIEIMSSENFSQVLNYSFDKFSNDPEYREEMSQFVHEADFGIKDIVTEQREISNEEFLKNIPLEFHQFLKENEQKKFHRKIKTTHSRFSNDGNEIDEIPFDFSKESEGSQRIFILSGLFINALKEGKILIFDELDSHLHPLLCQFILRLFHSPKKNPNNAQLIFTTHDISLLDKEFFRRDQIWFTEKDKYGASSLFSLSDLGERKEVSFSKRYLEGRYGALPYIKTLESDE